MAATSPGVRRRAFVSVQAIVANARAIAGSASLGSALIDVRANAYGHGVKPVCDALAHAGAAGFVVSEHEAIEVAERHGNLAIRVGGPDHRDATLTVLGPAVYGLTATQRPLRPALRLVAEAVAVKTVPAGRGVSYGYTYRTSSTTTLVLAGLGYADGIPRVASNLAPVAVNGAMARVTGRVAMDQFVVDVAETAVAVGADVVLFGDPTRGEPTALDWAQATTLRPEVLVSGLGPRIERVYTSV